jgi:pimeloyl-ACP methyl ester carboxylesterase
MRSFWQKLFLWLGQRHGACDQLVTCEKSLFIRQSWTFRKFCTILNIPMVMSLFSKCLLSILFFFNGGSHADLASIDADDIPLGITTIQYSVDGQTLSAATAGDPNNRPVLFIHGTHSSSAAFKALLSNPGLQKSFHLIAIDRPGYGGSGAGIAVTSLERQAFLIEPVLNFNKSGQKAIVVAHSFGGGVAGRFIDAHPERVARMILLAPSMSPELERAKWYDRLSQWEVFEKVLPKAWIVGGAEDEASPGELELLKPAWSKITVPVDYIQGTDDRIVSPKTADFAREVLVNATLNISMIPGQGHSIPQQRPDLVVKAIVETGH